MLSTEDFNMHHYVGFSQIRSHMVVLCMHASLGIGLWEIIRVSPNPNPNPNPSPNPNPNPRKLKYACLSAS